MANVQRVEVEQTLRGLPQDRQRVQRHVGVVAVDVVLQSGSAILQGDVTELGVLLHAKVSDDIRVFIRLPQQIHFSVGDAEAGGQHPLDSHVPRVEFTP